MEFLLGPGKYAIEALGFAGFAPVLSAWVVYCVYVGEKILSFRRTALRIRSFDDKEPLVLPTFKEIFKIAAWIVIPLYLTVSFVSTHTDKNNSLSKDIATIENMLDTAIASTAPAPQ